MPIQREWHYIDRQANREAVDQMLPPVLESSLIEPMPPDIARVLTTMGKTIDSMLRAILTVPWSLKHPCCICSLPIAVVGSGLVQDSKLGNWSSGVS